MVLYKGIKKRGKNTGLKVNQQFDAEKRAV
jgi:hypothetical protein